MLPPQAQSKIDENEAKVADLEEKVEALRVANAKLDEHNTLLVCYLPACFKRWRVVRALEWDD